MNDSTQRIKRTFLTRLTHGEDLLTDLESIIKTEKISFAVFSVIGAVQNAAFGYYDQLQRTYKSITREGGFEIISCSGNVSFKEDKPFIHAHILFGDENGDAFGGHLMSPTVLFAGELHLHELQGDAPRRRFDETTGLYLWE